MPFWSCETQGRSNAVFISVFKAILHLCIETPGICEKFDAEGLWIIVNIPFPLSRICLLTPYIHRGYSGGTKKQVAADGCDVPSVPPRAYLCTSAANRWLAFPGAPRRRGSPLVSHWLRKMVIDGWNWLDDLGIFGGNPHDLGNLHVIWLENLISLLKTSNTDLRLVFWNMFYFSIYWQ